MTEFAWFAIGFASCIVLSIVIDLILGKRWNDGA